jgi:hypothetical protein
VDSTADSRSNLANNAAYVDELICNVVRRLSCSIYPEREELEEVHSDSNSNDTAAQPAKPHILLNSAEL